MKNQCKIDARKKAGANGVKFRLQGLTVRDCGSFQKCWFVYDVLNGNQEWQHTKSSVSVGTRCALSTSVPCVKRTKRDAWMASTELWFGFQFWKILIRNSYPPTPPHIINKNKQGSENKSQMVLTGAQYGISNGTKTHPKVMPPKQITYNNMGFQRL